MTALRRHAPTWFVQLPWLITDSDREALGREIAGATPKAAAHALSAGERAAALLAFAAAIGHYEAALEVLQRDGDPDPPLRCRLLVALGEAQLRLARHGAARETFAQATALARQLEAVPLFARAAVGFGAAA
jgi:tetratricopeptide (TPR) repeat protein